MKQWNVFLGFLLVFIHHFMRTKPCYQNMVKDLYSTNTDFFFFLRDYFFARFLKQRIQKGLILPTNQKRKPMRSNGSDPKPRMQRCKAGQELIHLQAPQALMTVRKMK